MPAPVVTSEITRPSALRHRPIGAETEEVRFVTPRASRTLPRQEVHTTGSHAPAKKLTKHREQPYAQRHNFHWSLIAGLTMLGMLLVFWLAQQAIGWGMTTYDDMRYGRPRTVQTDAFVGHESGTTPSHFIALNDHGRVEIIEMPGGDPAHARIFLGPQIWGAQADLVPVNINFIPGSAGSKQMDMDVSFQNNHVRFHNEKGTFVLQTH
ncbi:hypothetical protein KDA_70230 [Dictyobacter alpinus]|uniref:Uncharacterized protein n=1 Tax=Dictyobacter alpinus TaxID=2014873 RepID=A0A402BJL5_9CHLR|nr:hypothetical protein [Dictyobacter alpinus]GCE31539.1 hypothetical protein KDA_70230 [Dictyobacter alpinus]